MHNTHTDTHTHTPGGGGSVIESRTAVILSALFAAADKGSDMVSAVCVCVCVSSIEHVLYHMFPVNSSSRHGVRNGVRHVECCTCVFWFRV